MTADKAGKSYWDCVWEGSALPEAVDPRARNPGNYVNRRFHEYFETTLGPRATRGKKLLEVGCGSSVRLPYFAKEFGYQVYGLDYSETGCRRAAEILSREGIEGTIVCSDLFSPPHGMAHQFDVVVSFGVVEHFQDAAQCLRALRRLLKPGGLVITSVPNMSGLAGALQKILNKPVFDKHVALDLPSLREAHEAAGLRVLDCRYFLSIEPGVCNLNGIPEDSMEWKLKHAILGLLTGLSGVVWLTEEHGLRIKPNRLTSPYVVCAATNL